MFLSLADSADPNLCGESDFDRTFDVSTDCGGVHSGRMRLFYNGVDYGDISLRPDQIEMQRGDLYSLKDAGLQAYCTPGEKATFQVVTLRFDHLDGSVEPATCNILLTPQGGSAHCNTVGTGETCVTTLVAVP